MAAQPDDSPSQRRDRALAAVRSRVWRSVSDVADDAEVLSYVRETFWLVATCYGKSEDDFSIADVKRAVDAVHGVMSRLGLENVTLAQFQFLARNASRASDLLNLVSFARAVAGLASGQLHWLLWHISKNLATPRLKRAAAVYIGGYVAVALYSGAAEEIPFEPTGLDPVLDSMDRETLDLIATHLSIAVEERTDAELIGAISAKLCNEGKDQAILRAWFPKDAASYVEVLVVVAKQLSIDVRGFGSCEQIEAAICTHLFQTIWERMTPEQRETLSREFRRDARYVTGEYVASAASLGTIGVAQMSGFAVYTAASTTLGFLSSSVGVTLPFAAYTGMSSAISVVIGPAGVAVAAFPAVFEFLRAKPEKLLGAIVVIATWRAKLIAEGDVATSVRPLARRQAALSFLAAGAAAGVLVAIFSRWVLP